MEQSTTGDVHLCEGDVQRTSAPRPDPPPLGWRALTLAVFGVAAAHLATTILSIVLLLQDYQLVTRVQADPSIVSRAEIAALAHRETSANALIELVFFAYIGAYIVWFVVTGKTVERYGGDRKAMLSHWTLIAWRVVIFGVFVLAVVLRNSAATESTNLDGRLTALLDSDRTSIFIAALRFPIVGLLVAGVWVVARRVYKLVEAQPPNSAPYPPPTAVSGARPLPRTAVQNGPGGDAFWREVDAAVTRSAGPLPLLEAWAAAPRARRWHLLTGEPEIAAVRNRLSPWSGITVYGQPPRSPDDAVLGQLADEARRLRDDAAAGGAIGLIEEDGGKLRFEQLTSDAALESWLGHARSAIRAGVYPTHAAGDPAALSSA